MMDDSLLLYKILKNRTGAEISASGNPAIMSDTLKNNPMNEMKVFGWSKQETTKGKNLFDFSRLVSDGVNVMNYEKQTITVPAKTNNTGYNQTLRDLCPGITPGTYVFSAKRSNPESGNGSYFLEAGLDFTFNTPTELTDALLDSHIAWYNNPDSEVENVISEIQIEIGTEATDYEPYTGGQPSPSPDYPQEIVSAGAGGEVEVTICGKNLFDGNTDISKTQYYKLPIQMKKGAKLTMSFIGVGTGSGAVKAYCHDSELNFCNTFFYFDAKSGVNKYSSTITCSGGEKNIFFYKTSFTRLFEKIYDIQIEINDVTTDYTPYHEPQFLSISTQTGLPAIPVDSDGNYTDANGQQWIADYADLKRGKYVQNICDLPLKDINLEWNTWGVNVNTSNGTGFYAYLTKYAHVGNTKTLATICQHNADAWGGRKIGCNAEVNSNYITISLHTSDLDDASDNTKAIASFKKIVEQTDTHVLYVRAEPIERDLTPEEIQAYKNLVTYARTTIVENDAECYMEVSAGGGDSLRAKKLALILGE